MYRLYDIENMYKTAELYAKLDTYKRRIERTQERIRKSLEVVNNPYIALSCGKDSSVMADMILKQKPVKCRCITRGETRLLYDIDKVLSYFKMLTEVEEICFDRLFSQEWIEATFEEQKTAGNNDIRGINNDGYDGVFMGLRIEENRNREISLKTHQTKALPQYVYKYKNQSKEFFRLCPIADWTTQDVAAYTVTNSIPLLDWYNSNGFEARTATRLNNQAIKNNTLFYLKLNNPNGYRVLISRFPELSIF